MNRLKPGEHSTYPYVYVDGIYLKRNWGSKVQNVAVLVAIGINVVGYSEIIGAAEDMKEDRESRRPFFVWLKKRGLKGVHLINSLGCLKAFQKSFQK